MKEGRERRGDGEDDEEWIGKGEGKGREVKREARMVRNG